MPGQPSIFISYSHEDRDLARALADGLDAAGHRIWIDEGEILIGESLIEKIATAINEVDFLLALVTEASVESPWCQKELSLAVTGELGREGIRVLPVRVGAVEMPPALRDQRYLRLDPSDVDAAVQKLNKDVAAYGERVAAPPGASVRRRRGPVARPRTSARVVPEALEPITIVGLVEEGIGEPRDDNTRGSALYRVPLRLSGTPSPQWARHFEETWNHPPQFTTMHRPGILSVVGDTIVLDGTTIEELERVHLPTLRLVLAKVNADVAAHEAKARTAREREEQERQAHRDNVREAAERLDFGTRATEAPASDLLPEQEELLRRLVEEHNSMAPDRPSIRITRYTGRYGARIFLWGKKRRPVEGRAPFADFDELRRKGYLRQLRKSSEEIIYAITPEGFDRTGAVTPDEGS